MKSPRVSYFATVALFLASSGSNFDLSRVSAFAATPATKPVQNRSVRAKDPNGMQTSFSFRGGATSPSTTIMKSSAAASVPKGGASKVRISAFDSMRFILIVNIVLGHFIRFANPPDFWFKFFSQHNVLVGAFFALSGYVTAYTTTENAKREASPKLTSTPAQQWILTRVFGFYPLHLFVLLLFSPMFWYADAHYNGAPTAAFHGFLSATMTQAWFPNRSEIWNAPTWFLSALTFATSLMPFSLPRIAQMNKASLTKTAMWLWIVNTLPKVGYMLDFNAWSIVEGVASPKALPNAALFNFQRFSPLAAASEVLLGAVVCRLVMLDDDPNEKTRGKTSALSTIVPLAGIVGSMALRGADILKISDLIYRSFVFVPLFLRFLMAAHRNTVRNVGDPIVSLLSNKFLVGLGNLAFPIYILHGPIGQCFYKKLIATKLFGSVLMGPANFGLYLGSVLVAAWVLQQAIMKNRMVAKWSKASVDSLSKVF